MKAATYQVFQIGLGMHSGGEAGISTALELEIAAALAVLCEAMDSDGDTHERRLMATW